MSHGLSQLMAIVLFIFPMVQSGHCVVPGQTMYNISTYIQPDTHCTLYALKAKHSKPPLLFIALNIIGRCILCHVPMTKGLLKR